MTAKPWAASSHAPLLPHASDYWFTMDLGDKYNYFNHLIIRSAAALIEINLNT